MVRSWWTTNWKCCGRGLFKVLLEGMKKPRSSSVTTAGRQTEIPNLGPSCKRRRVQPNRPQRLVNHTEWIAYKHRHKIRVYFATLLKITNTDKRYIGTATGFAPWATASRRKQSVKQLNEQLRATATGDAARPTFSGARKRAKRQLWNVASPTEQRFLKLNKTIATQWNAEGNEQT
jgi:hypothetical protein